MTVAVESLVMRPARSARGVSQRGAALGLGAGLAAGDGDGARFGAGRGLGEGDGEGLGLGDGLTPTGAAVWTAGAPPAPAAGVQKAAVSRSSRPSIPATLAMPRKTRLSLVMSSSLARAPYAHRWPCFFVGPRPCRAPCRG